jgi:CheY-like chemotaxis protein
VEREPRAAAVILVVDDDRDSREALRDFLQIYGYSVELAGNGAEALDLLATSEPTLILTDIHMPIVDGRELITRIRQIPRCCHLPIGIVTGGNSSLEGYETLVTFVKPVDPERLLEFVRRSIDASVSRNAEKSSLGNDRYRR